MKDLKARFFSKINKQPDGCWRWVGAIQSGGYGNFRVGGKYARAHLKRA